MLDGTIKLFDPRWKLAQLLPMMPVMMPMIVTMMMTITTTTIAAGDAAGGRQPLSMARC
jgi:hypothetical protein